MLPPRHGAVTGAGVRDSPGSSLRQFRDSGRRALQNAWARRLRRLKSFVFAEFYRKTGKATFANSAQVQNPPKKRAAPPYSAGQNSSSEWLSEEPAP